MFIGAIAGIVVALGVFGAVVWQRLELSSRFGTPRFSATRSASTESGPSTEKASADSRPVYRYSVIPGGVRTPEELLEAMANDSVVAGHYAGIDKAHLTTARISEPLQAHVSYRIGERVYWTKRKITIQAGEQIVTDGKTLVRGRCGNNISVAPLLPTLDNEPKPDVFDSIVAAGPAESVVKLDPAHSYFTPKDLRTPQGSGGSGSAPFGGSSGIGFPIPPPSGSSVPGTSTSGEVTPNGVPPGGNPPGGPPGSPCEATAAINSKDAAPPAVNQGCGGNPPGGNPPGGDPKGDPPGDPPTDVTPRDVPNTPTPVPEPGTLLLVAGGAAALLARRVRQKAHRATSASQKSEDRSQKEL